MSEELTNLAKLHQRAIRERDFYRSLLALGTESGFEPFLEEALALIVELTGAEQAYLEVRDPEEDDGQRSWCRAHGCSEDEIERIRSHISRGILAEALSSGETVVTRSARDDRRFRERESVQLSSIEAVLCAPLGEGAAQGAVYLQGKERGEGFTETDRRYAEAFARHLGPLADRLITRQRMEEVHDFTRSLRQRYALPGIVGHSRALAQALEQAMLAAPLDVNVLLTGDSGTGKSQLARVIHANSPRADGPFVELNCAALPLALLESELFGARAGSHSEARRDRTGLVAAAEQGTLFLDEIGEMPLESQPKLLQLLQTREYYPLGASRAERADVRVIAATNTDLERAVREKRFREDLFFRLQVLPVRMPSLRERTSDLPSLAHELVADVSQRHGIPLPTLGPSALRAIQSTEWPGNVRELANALEAAVVRAAGEGSATLQARHVFPEASDAGIEEASPESFQEATRRFQRELLLQTLDELGWNVAATARRLDLARSHVYNLIGTFGLERR